MIDVAGAALLSAAARNAAGVVAVCGPDHYPLVVEELRTLGQVCAETRYRLAADAFGTVAAYYAEIAAYLNQISSNVYPQRLALVLEKVSDLPYGENPHQRAAFYRETTHRAGSLADATQLQGAPPTFNNLLDLDAAYRIAADYTAPTVVITKHTDPVGIASAEELVEAYKRALDTDPVVVVRRHRRRQPRARRPDGARDRRELVRGGHRARLLAGRARDPARQAGPGAAVRAGRRPPRACATTGSRTSTSSASAAACSSRRSTRSTSTAASSRS